MIPAEEEKKSKEAQIDTLMDALSNIHPQYIEEARQAVSSESSDFSGNHKFRKFFNRTWLSKKIRGLFHSSIARTAAAACLILLMITAGFHSQTLFTRIESGGFAGSSKNEWAPSDIYTDSDPSDIYTSSDPFVSENSPSPQVSPSETAAEAEKSALESGAGEKEKSAAEEKSSAGEKRTVEDHSGIDVVQEAPPDLTLSLSGSGDTSFVACAASDVWNCSDLPVLTLNEKDSITLQFSENEPDSLIIRYLPASAAAESNQTNTQEVSLSEDYTFQLPEKTGTYIVEIQVFWDKEIYEGNCTYGFQVQYQ